jgi:hypothetical protein
MARAVFALITDNTRLLTDGSGTGEEYIKDRRFPWDFKKCLSFFTSTIISSHKPHVYKISNCEITI